MKQRIWIQRIRYQRTLLPPNQSVNACFENSDSSMAYLAMDWSSDFTLQFLKLYRNERCLWDPLDEHYKRREYVTGAWHRLVESTGKPLAELKRKRESLMATFRGHSRRKKASMMEGAEGSAVYQPVWFAFNLMESFLGEVYGIQNTNDVNTADVETSDSTDLPHQEEYDYFSSAAPTPSRAVATPPPSHQHPAKRRRTTIEPRDTENVVTEIYTLLNSVLAKKEEEEDECEMYCKIMVKRLRKIPEHERQQLMHDMDGMVLKAMFRARNDEANSSNSYSMEPSTSMRSSRGHRNLRNEEEEIDSKADIVLFEEGDR
ncbi:uncharacterized protein LOC123688619 isoform X2 [Harmonia axyridis]|uniref:uncharacterized protein LOC123688619 isoform X2 n=1 Tax=Harmonia axyridis TaxID=115357 RepID=UPI001E275636|nr:uncharacterized protein LOC123688619 isoform X2 [Harmonia axyridis]